jgi:hypothetical protein
MLLLQRIVRMGGPVDDDMANLIVAQLLYLDSADQTKDITMYVNSPGGSVTAGGAGRCSTSACCVVTHARLLSCMVLPLCYAVQLCCHSYPAHVRCC